MGNKKEKREKFLAEHKLCCFCGGEALAVEEDHIPSRALFDNRQWPEGYVFPTCVSCNRKTRQEESVVAFMARVYSATENDLHAKDLEKYAKSLEYNYPGFINRIFPNARELRNAVNKYNIELPNGVAKTEAPLIKADDPIIDQAIMLFGRKLLLALYYKHAGKPLTKDGGIALSWYTNLQVANGQIPEQMRSTLSNVPTFERCKTSLGDQFWYSYGITECKEGSAYIIHFRRSFSIVGFVYADADRFKKTGEAEIYGAF